MYWTDTGSVPKIERASMDGGSRIALHSTSLSTPYGLTLDIDTQTLYWMDYSRNVLEKSNADGTNRAILTSRLIADPYFLDYYDGILYWGDFTYNRLLSTPVSSPNSVAYFGSSLGSDIYGIHVISPEKQREGQLSELCIQVKHCGKQFISDIALDNYAYILFSPCSTQLLCRKQWQLQSPVFVELHCSSRLQLCMSQWTNQLR